ncbi:6882_t:CDS:1, partial [Acaulospora morrowiae]
SVLIETSVGDIVIDLQIKKCPKTSLNFLKLCKIKYYNFCCFHNVQKDFMVQT